MKTLNDMIGKEVTYSLFTPNGIHRSVDFQGILKEVEGHLIAVERENSICVINTMSAVFEDISIRIK